MTDMWFEVPNTPSLLLTKDGRAWSKWFNRERKLSIGNHGYYVVSIKGRPELLHRLIAETFISNPDSKPCINHKNGVKTDNRIENLEWVTYSENSKHSYSVLGRKSAKGMLGIKGALNKRSIPIKQLSLEGELIREWSCANEASSNLSINNSDIRQCCRGKLKSAGGFLWVH